MKHNQNVSMIRRLARMVQGNESLKAGLSLERLETRDQPAVAFMKVDTLMFIADSGEKNEVFVYVENGNVILKDDANLGSAFVVPIADVDSIMIQLGNLDDRADLSGVNLTDLFVEIQGGEGNDTLVGSESTDAIYGGAGNDVIHGRGGKDYLFGGEGNDNMNGGLGDDRFIIEDVKSSDLITDDGGFDTLDLTLINDKITVAYIEDQPIPAGSTISGQFETTEIDRVITGGGDDTFVLGSELEGAGMAGQLNGGGGTNTLDLSRASTGVDVNLGAGTATGTAGITNIQQVIPPPIGSNNIVGGDNKGGIDPITDPRVIAITALRNYVQESDPSYRFELVSTQQGFVPFVGSYTAYSVNMISQKWRNAAEVNRTEWQHILTIIVPDFVTTDTALLVVDGGNNPAEPLDGTLLDVLAIGAIQSQSTVVYLSTVPNQPLTFSGDPGNPRTEDEILAYSFDQYLHTNDPEWPVLVAMVKSAVKAMDTAQAFLPSVRSSLRINDFVVTGASKRGWTTWLTAAVDPRVKASVPIVIDMLNMEANIEHIFDIYGFVPNALTPYRELNVFSQFDRRIDEGLYRILDPLNYVADTRGPILALNSTGDQFFAPDAGQYYQRQIEGLDRYRVRYLPNTDHGLDLAELGPFSQAFESLITFYRSVIDDVELPKYSWQILEDGSILGKTDDPRLVEVNVWEATNPWSRDLRLQTFVNQLGIDDPWTIVQTFTPNATGTYQFNQVAPPTGATGFVMEFVFDSGYTDIFGFPVFFIYTTETRVVSNEPSFNMDFGDAPLSYGVAQHDLSQIHVHLGTKVDAEYINQDSADALGDDNQTSIQTLMPGSPIIPEYNDEDGVTFLTPLQAGATASIQVVAASDGFLNAWIDFNDDGDFLDVGEQIFTDLFLDANTHVLQVNIPGSATIGQTFSRFRFTAGPGVGAFGVAPNGEVEDYQVNII